MSTEREMTLDEWCALLYESHLVNRQLRELRSALSARASAEDAGDFASDTAALAFLRLVGNGNPNIERAVKRLHSSLIARASAGEGGVGWPNGSDKTVPAALRYLAEHERPVGGEQRYNSAHLYQLADEVERMASRLLTAAPQPAQAGASGGGDAAKPLGYVLESDLAQLDANDSGTIWPFPAEATDQISGKRCGSVPVYLTPASPATGEDDVRLCHCCGETFDRCRETYRGDSGEWDDGVKACIAWVEKRRHDFESEYGMVDPSTGAMEFRSVAKEEYDCELGEIEEGLRSLLAAAPQPQPQPQDHIADADKIMVTPPAHGDGEVSEESLRAWRKMADEVHGRFFWRLSPDKHGNHTVSHESVRAVVELCEEIEAGTPAYENLTTRPTPEAQEARDAALLAKWIIRHHDDFPSWITIDHACAQCVPDGELLMPGFVCAYHIAERIDAALALPARGEGK